MILHQMPKGVEHFVRDGEFLRFQPVILHQMPKGVEHFVRDGEFLRFQP